MSNTEALRAAAQQALVALVHHTEQTRPIQRTADAIAALRAAVAQQPAASGVPVAPRWWKCDTHGAARVGAWGCPECVRELRGEKTALEGWITCALTVLRTLEGEDSEDGNQELRKLLIAGQRLVCKHPNMQTKHFTYGMRSHCPDCGHSDESWWD